MAGRITTGRDLPFEVLFLKKYKSKRTSPKAINLKAYGRHKKLSAFISGLKRGGLALKVITYHGGPHWALVAPFTDHPSVFCAWST